MAIRLRERSTGVPALREQKLECPELTSQRAAACERAGVEFVVERHMGAQVLYAEVAGVPAAMEVAMGPSELAAAIVRLVNVAYFEMRNRGAITAPISQGDSER